MMTLLLMLTEELLVHLWSGDQKITFSLELLGQNHLKLLTYLTHLLVKEDSLHHKLTGTSAGMTATLVMVEKVVVVHMALSTLTV